MSTTEVNSNNADIDVDNWNQQRKKSEVDNIIPIVTYDEEETGYQEKHTYRNKELRSQQLIKIPEFTSIRRCLRRDEKEARIYRKRRC